MDKQIPDLNRRDLIRAAAAVPLLSARLAARESSDTKSPDLDADHLPFSRFGSYWAVSKRWNFGSTEEIPAGEWYIRLLEDDVTPNELFRMEVDRDGEKVPFTGVLTPLKLTLSAESRGSIEFVLEAPDALRVRGKGCSLRLYGIKGSYGYAVQRSPNAWEVLASVNMPRVLVRALAGSLLASAPWSDELH